MELIHCLYMFPLVVVVDAVAVKMQQATIHSIDTYSCVVACARRKNEHESWREWYWMFHVFWAGVQ